MKSFEELLSECRGAVERYCKFKLPTPDDADDVLSEVYLTAYRKLYQLKSEESFKPWIIGIAKRKCADWFRERARLCEVPLDEVPESELTVGRMGYTLRENVRSVLSDLNASDREVLYLFYFAELPQTDIANRLGIPLGTVKSRLYTARENFRRLYPHQEKTKGESAMKKLPEFLPNYTIKKSDKSPFEVRHEELPGMLIVPRLGEKLSFGMYDLPERKLSGMYHLEAKCDIILHGIRGTLINSEYTDIDGQKEKSSTIAQLTDSHCRYLGGMSFGDDGANRIITFLDGKVFSDAYAIGEDNCGFEVNRRPKGNINEQDNGLVTDKADDVSDIVGRFDVTIGGKHYDTIRLVDIQWGNAGHTMCEYYLDQNGRTVLWRRFNRDDWAYHRYGKKWTEMLPDNERITVNGETYVHWYDCITDYIL